MAITFEFEGKTFVGLNGGPVFSFSPAVLVPKLEQTMKYLCLVYFDEARLGELPDEDCVAYDTEIRNSGHCIASEALQSVQTATTVRVRDNNMSITDGPFAETQEQLTGFYLIEAQNLDEAIRIAAKIPQARVGSIEVRPIPETVVLAT